MPNEIQEQGATPSPEVANVFNCYDCGEEKPMSDSVVLNGNSHMVCNSCFENYTECDKCGDDVRNRNVYTYEDSSYCSGCYDEVRDENDDDEEERSDPERHYSDDNLAEFQSQDAGKFITSQRVFSAELECYYPDSDTMRDVARALPRAIGIEHDGSLSSNGIEFQTPKMQGMNGEKQILNLCKVLNQNDFSIRTNAGLHLHLDGKGLMPKTKTRTRPSAIVELWSFYIVFEDVVLSFLPNSRRNNRYANLVKNEFQLKELKESQSLQDLEKIWYRQKVRKNIAQRKRDKYDNSRYMGINLHSLFANGHLEVRYHSGTINATKILEWTNLHQTIIDRACNGALRDSLQSASAMPNLADKTKMFFDVLQLPERAEEYFKRRQAQFTKIEEGKEENTLDTEVTASLEIVTAN